MKKRCWLAVSAWLSFVLWTVAVCCVDVAPIGPYGSAVGFATWNRWFHQMTDVHWVMYILTDWLSLVPVAVCLVFAVIGLHQWVRRKRLSFVDVDILVLGGFYLVTIVMYLLFETVVINYRPIVIAGCLEASYPSSTTVLVLCVMLTAIRQVRRRVHCAVARYGLVSLMVVFVVAMVLGRLLSGVHWFTDVVGGVLCSVGLVRLYDIACYVAEKR